jgi:hypothetical protein
MHYEDRVNCKGRGKLNGNATANECVVLAEFASTKFIVPVAEPDLIFSVLSTALPLLLLCISVVC